MDRPRMKAADLIPIVLQNLLELKEENRRNKEDLMDQMDKNKQDLIYKIDRQTK